MSPVDLPTLRLMHTKLRLHTTCSGPTIMMKEAGADNLVIVSLKLTDNNIAPEHLEMKCPAEAAILTLFSG